MGNRSARTLRLRTDLSGRISRWVSGQSDWNVTGRVKSRLGRFDFRQCRYDVVRVAQNPVKSDG